MRVTRLAGTTALQQGVQCKMPHKALIRHLAAMPTRPQKKKPLRTKPRALPAKMGALKVAASHMMSFVLANFLEHKSGVLRRSKMQDKAVKLIRLMTTITLQHYMRSTAALSVPCEQKRMSLHPSGLFMISQSAEVLTKKARLSMGFEASQNRKLKMTTTGNLQAILKLAESELSSWQSVERVANERGIV
jgi:hypothetical protein